MTDISRREFTKRAALSAGAAIIGYDGLTRSWVTEASASGRSFQDVPPLDGVLVRDETSRIAIAVDGGNMFHRIPAAVLRPGSVQDIVKMVRYANRNHLEIATKGDGHSRYGQTQA